MSSSAPTHLVVCERRRGVFLVALQRPESKNALDLAMVNALHAALDDAGREPAVLVLRSLVDGVFASGADLRELMDRDADAAFGRINIDLFERLARFRWPTIAVVDGPALGGGCEMAMACDFRVVSPRARFGQPETALGVLAGAGGNWRLPQLVGISLARRMLLAGEMVDGDHAVPAGLADRIGPDPLASALEMAEQIGRRSWRALELTKSALRTAERPSTNFDVAAQALLFEGDDKRERIGRFLDRAKDRRDGARSHA